MLDSESSYDDSELELINNKNFEKKQTGAGNANEYATRYKFICLFT